MAITGLLNSFLHVDNGMTMEDMTACKAVANRLNEVIIFRSTGSWSMRWIARGYPTKNFHVKGKSSDWGPQAGFVPYEGKYSKVGANAGKASEGTTANEEGIVHKYAAKVQLKLTLAELREQVDVPAGNPRRTAIAQMESIEKSPDLLLRAERDEGGGRMRSFVFRAVWSDTDRAFKIFVYKDTVKENFPALRYSAAATGGGLDAKQTAMIEPLMVMTSSEIGADNKPMTGDYDLMAVCPPWTDYGNTTAVRIHKPAVDFGSARPTVGQTFEPGSNLDLVLDMKTNTGAVGHSRMVGEKLVKTTFQGLDKKYGGKSTEHADMGNVTGRILRCINALNAEMPNGATALRRVHHNAESHRNHIFGAISGSEMEGGDGVPLTVFQPAALYASRTAPTAVFGDVSTFESLGEFKRYAVLLNEAGYFVPRNWTWGMSIRDRVRGGEFAAVETAVGRKALI